MAREKFIKGKAWENFWLIPRGSWEKEDKIEENRHRYQVSSTSKKFTPSVCPRYTTTLSPKHSPFSSVLIKVSNVLSKMPLPPPQQLTVDFTRCIVFHFDQKYWLHPISVIQTYFIWDGYPIPTFRRFAFLTYFSWFHSSKPLNEDPLSHPTKLIPKEMNRKIRPLNFHYTLKLLPLYRQHNVAFLLIRPGRGKEHRSKVHLSFIHSRYRLNEDKKK
jgi:hypothetical protein